MGLHHEAGHLRLGFVPVQGLVAVVLASLVNIFLQSSGMQFAISVTGVLVFAGLTAYDTQRIKDGYLMVRGDAEAMLAKSTMGALSLYLDFINMFIMLQLFGNRNSRGTANARAPRNGAPCFGTSCGASR